MSDEKTANRLYLLPASDNTLAVDLNRLRASLVQIDTDVAANLIADAARAVLIANNAASLSANSASITANSASITANSASTAALKLVLQGFINGLITARNATTPNTHIDIGVGSAWAGDHIVGNAATFIKRLDAIWLAGSGNGGLFSGIREANTWYHLFILRNDTTGAIDFGFDTSVSGANRPAGWAARLIWSVRTDGSSNIIPYVQTGDVCTWVTPPFDLYAVGGVSSANGTLYTISTPLGLSCSVQIFVGAGSASGEMSGQIHYVSSPSTADLFVTTYAFGGRYTTRSFSTEGTLAATLTLLTNTSSQIRVRAIGSVVTSDVITASTNFYIHPRGRLV